MRFAPRALTALVVMGALFALVLGTTQVTSAAAGTGTSAVQAIVPAQGGEVCPPGQTWGGDGCYLARPPYRPPQRAPLLRRPATRPPGPWRLVPPDPWLWPRRAVEF